MICFRSKRKSCLISSRHWSSPSWRSMKLSWHSMCRSHNDWEFFLNGRFKSQRLIQGLCRDWSCKLLNINKWFRICNKTRVSNKRTKKNWRKSFSNLPKSSLNKKRIERNLLKRTKDLRKKLLFFKIVQMLLLFKHRETTSNVAQNNKTLVWVLSRNWNGIRDSMSKTTSSRDFWWRCKIVGLRSMRKSW